MKTRPLKQFPIMELSAIVVLAICLISALCSGQGIGIEPKVEVDEKGNAKIVWQTKHNCTNGMVSFGIEFEDDPFGLPHYRLRVSATGCRRSHKAELSLKKIEDIAGGTPYKGNVFYRATCFDLSSKTWLDTGDCAFRYVKREDSYRRGVAIIEGAIVANVTANSVLLRWATDLPSLGRVCVGEKSVTAFGLGTEHEVAVDGLEAGATYPYHIEAWTDNDDIFRTRCCAFRTAPEPGSDEPFSFAVFSDTRANDYTPIATQALNGANADVLRDIAICVYREKASFAVVPGDLIYGITGDVHEAELEFRSWKKAVGPVARYIPFYTGLGNHDAEIYDHKVIEGKEQRVRKKGKDAAEEIFRREMTNPTNGPDVLQGSDGPTYSENVYSFDYGDSHFVMLNNDYKVIRGASDDCEKGKIVGRQLEWLRSDLERATARHIENIFVFLHEPAFPNGGHLADSMYYNGNKAYVEPRNEFWRLLCKHNVVAVFCGHEHNYSRTLIDGKVEESFPGAIWQIVTGGGGAPFHSQDSPPWSQSVKAFSARQHYCVVNVSGKKVRLRVPDKAGNPVDEADLK